jgi:4-hydroxy-tetrahydrodipicolinate reductase
MKIAIIGYGRMGREIEQSALLRGHEVVSIIDPAAEGATHTEVTARSLAGADVAIDFTAPKAVVPNIEKVAAHNVNMVVGTTGWSDEVRLAKEVVESSGIGFIWAPNFSIGINVFYEIIKHASRLFNKLEEYDVLCHEWHHKGKLDSPSGTARKIADTVDECLNRMMEPGELHVSSTRGGWMPGTHEVIFDSEFDSIELVHRARTRGGLVAGALRAAEWIKDRKGFFEFTDYLHEVLGL